MKEWLFIEEKVEEYYFYENLSDELDDLLDHFERKDRSHSLKEDINRLSEICSRYSNKKVVYIYQELLKKGYYIDEYYLFDYSLDKTEKLLKELILMSINESNNKIIKMLEEASVDDFVDQIIDDNKMDFEENFEKKFINSQGKGIYYCERKNDLIDLILHLPMEQIYNSYVKYLNNKGLSQLTIANYTVDLRMLMQWLEEKNLSYTDLDRSVAKEYLENILRSHKTNSYNKILLSLSSFNKYLIKIGIYDQLFFIQKKDQIKDLTSHEVEIFDEEVQEKIVALLKEKHLSERTRLVIGILFFTGLRVSELVNIKLKNIDYEKKELVVIGKGKKKRKIPLKSCVIKYMKEYINNDREKSNYSKSEYLIISQRSKKMSREAINRITKRIKKYVGCNVYPHKFRHTFASMLVRKGVLISTVAEILGHRDIQTTIEYYVNTSNQDKIRAIEIL